MTYILLILMSAPLLAFNIWAWYIQWEEMRPETRFKTKTFYLSLGAYVLTIRLINQGINSIDEFQPFALYIKILLFLAYVFLAYLGYKKGKSKMQVEVI